MGDAQKWIFEPSFNRATKVRGRGHWLTSTLTCGGSLPRVLAAFANTRLT